MAAHLNVNDDQLRSRTEREIIMEQLQNIIVTEKEIQEIDAIGFQEVKQRLIEAITTLQQSIASVSGPGAGSQNENYPGILVYGLAGTGKTCLVKWVAKQLETSFVSVHASDFISRYTRLNEKGMKYLFEYACDRQPSIIFIDDIDILSVNDRNADSEPSRRVITELFVQMSSLVSKQSRVIVIAASCCPWKMSSAFHRRFSRHVYIHLPDLMNRSLILQNCLNRSALLDIEENDWSELAEKTDGFSPADLLCLCRDATMAPIREVIRGTHFKPATNSESVGSLWMVCSSNDPDGQERTYESFEPEQLHVRPLCKADLFEVLAKTRPSLDASQLLEVQQFHNGLLAVQGSS